MQQIETHSTKSRVHRVVLWLVLGVVSIAAIWAGVDFRQWWFRVTTPVHFNDIERNWLWGSYTYYNIHDKDRLFLDTYDDVGIQGRDNALWIDYAPARLLVNTIWVASNHDAMPYQWIKRWAHTHDVDAIYDFHWFYRVFNTSMELLASIAAFLLVRNVVRSAGGSETKATLLAWVSGLLLWFNVAMINSAHGWPSGDMWIIPPFLWAVYLCRTNRWFVAGAVLAIGVLFKGQQLFVMSVLILWPLLQLRWREPLRLLAGIVGTFGLLTAGWTLTYIDEYGVRHISVGALIVASMPVLLLIALLILRWKVPKLRLDRVPVRPAAMCAFGLAGLLAFSSMWMFGTSYAWFDASYAYGTDHWPHMMVGVTSNLPGIMDKRYDWSHTQGPMEVVWQVFAADSYSRGLVSRLLPDRMVPDPIDITLRTFLFIIFAAMLLLSAIGLAMHDRRRSTRFLVALVTPWLAFYAIPCQIHERYLLFAACVACVCIGHSVGMTLLGVFCTILTMMMTQQVMFHRGDLGSSDRLLHETAPWLFAGDGFVMRFNAFIRGTHPDIGWAVLLVLGVFLYVTVTPIFRRRRADCRDTASADPTNPTLAYTDPQPCDASSPTSSV